ncbi:MAG: ribosome recycling factor [Rhodothalassiaceae bacterium]
MSEGIDKRDLQRRMDGAVDNLKHEFSGLRTGRANTGLLDPIQVDVYGASMPIAQVGSITVPEPRMLTVQVWDQNNVSAVEKAIRNSGLGLNPMIDGQTVRIPVPELNEERRRDLAKMAGKYAEQARISVRNVRRDGMDALKKAEKNGDIGKDDHKRLSDEVQSMTDKTIGKIDDLLTQKEKEIMQV